MTADRSRPGDDGDPQPDRRSVPAPRSDATTGSVPDGGEQRAEHAATQRARAAELAEALRMGSDNSTSGLFEGSGVTLTTREITNSAGDRVQRHTVENEDDLLRIADHVAGGRLDDLDQVKPDYWQGRLADGTWRKIEFNPAGHANTNEGPHVKVMGLHDPTGEPSKGNRWRTEGKVFIEGRETWQ